LTRYRRRPLEREESAAALATSVVLGAGVAALALYVTRLLLSREPLSGAAASDVPEGSNTLPKPRAALVERGPPADGRAGSE